MKEMMQGGKMTPEEMETMSKMMTEMSTLMNHMAGRMKGKQPQ
jgi:hypothetical protein